MRHNHKVGSNSRWVKHSQTNYFGYRVVQFGRSWVCLQGCEVVSPEKGWVKLGAVNVCSDAVGFWPSVEVDRSGLEAITLRFEMV